MVVSEQKLYIVIFPTYKGGEGMNNHGYQKKIVECYEKLARVVNAHKELGDRIVATIGSWDLLHIGHLRYLMQAKSRGDILVVGVDTDRAIKLYKGPLRPVVPQNERSEMLGYQSCVDLITLVDDVDEKGIWQYSLLKKIKPDVYVAVEDSYSEKQQKEIREMCGELVVLPRQAENTSTSRLIQRAVKGHLQEILEKM
mgnify:CR=1 FL=1